MADNGGIKESFKVGLWVHNISERSPFQIILRYVPNVKTRMVWPVHIHS